MEKMTILKTEYDALESEINAQAGESARLERQVEYLLEQMRLSRHRQFGASSEKSEYDAEQLNLFNDAEAFAAPEAPEQELQAIEKHYRKKQRELPSKLPEDLPVEVVEHNPARVGADLSCVQRAVACDGKKVVCRELKLIPAKAILVEHVQYTYACRNCEKTTSAFPL